MAKKKIETTQVYIVADLSGSMVGAKEDTLRRMTTDFVNTLAKAKGQKFNVSFVAFSGHVVNYGAWDAKEVGQAQIGLLTTRTFGGQTALRDGIGAALERVEASPDVPALVSVFSDGQENASWQYSAARLEALIAKLEKTGNLTLTFAGPRSARDHLATIGVPAGNFREWDGSEAELHRVSYSTTQAVDNYVTTRSLGVTNSKSFYADVSQLTDQGVRAMTKKVDPAEVKKVSARMAGRSIADFYGRAFKPGAHFYELVKAERIQDGKDLVVYIKDKNEYRLGSRTARAILGLPETGDIRVRPSAHSDKYQIFVQSSSNNRKVVEGQTMLTVD